MLKASEPIAEPIDYVTLWGEPEREGNLSAAERRDICPYVDKQCNFWDGDCLAEHPCQCPYLTDEEVESL